MGPTNEGALHLAGRQQPGAALDHLRRACATPIATRRAAWSTAAVDLLLVETIFDTLNAKAALVAIDEVFDELGVRLPVMISATITDRSGRTLSGQTLDAFYVSIEHARPFSVGLNCALGARDMRPYLAELARIATCYVTLLSERRPPQRLRRVRRAARRDRRPDPRFRRERVRQHRRRLLRHDARSHPRHREGRGRPAATAGASRAGRHADSRLPTPDSRSRLFLPLCRARDAGAASRLELPDDRRAHQRHRLEEIRAAGQGGRLVGGGRGGARAGARRRQHPRRQHGRGHARFRSVHDRVPELHRHRARDRTPADHDRQLEVVGHRGRAQVRAGQGHRQLDQPQGRRSRLPGQGPHRPPLRRGDGRDGLRRAGPGRHDRAQGRDLPARLPAADRAGRLRRRPTSSSTRTSWRSPPASRSTTTTR